jgi:hypothetical protein
MIIAPKGTFRESKRPHRFGGYVALMRFGGCLNGLNGVEFGNNSIMTLFKDLFHSMGTDHLRGACCDALELILLSLLLELHG